MTQPTPQFTAAQIAAALGKAKRTVLCTLAGITPTGQLIVSGNAAQAWTLESLPLRMRDELNAIAKAHRYRDAAHLLAAPPQSWKPTVRLSEVAASALDKATKLQRALARVLSLQSDLSRTSAELEQIGLEDYKRAFSYAITDRALRGLVKRTIERDGGTEDFSRLELYLDERPARKAPLPSAPRPGDEVEFRDLREVIAAFKQPNNPSDKELSYLWLRAFELYEARLAEPGAKAKRIRNALVRFLFAVLPALATHEAALRRMFKRKLARWQNNERQIDSLADLRSVNSGFNRAPELGAADRDALIAHAVLHCDGRVSQAWRELCQRNALSESLLSYYVSNPASKSYCPTRIREAVQHEIAMMDDIHHGPRTDKLNGAHLLRDWSGVAPMDWITGDDATLEVYFYIPDGEGWFTLTRGQFLIFTDCRTDRILSFALLPEKNYNSRVIRTAITRLCDEHGLPRRGFYFEGGTWDTSRLIKGDKNADVSWPEAELGLRALGLEFKKSRLPRSKPVERVIGAVQDLLDGEPGNVGRDEMHERYERVHRAKQLVTSRKEHPSKYFYSLDEWESRIEAFCAQYNAERQDGKKLQGLSPDDAFLKFEKRDDPPIKLPAGCRYLLSHHKRPLRVTSNGITLRFGKQAYNYRNSQTGALRGQMVLAWFNPELPEMITITDMNRGNAFTVERTQEIPAMDAPEELLTQEMERANAHLSYARTRYRTLKAKFSVPFRRTVADADAVNLGVEIAVQQNAAKERIATEQKQQVRARKTFKQLGMNAPREIRPGQVEAAERLSQLLKEEDSK